MAREDSRAFGAAVVDRLRRMVRRRAVCPDERTDILVAARALGIHPADPLEDYLIAVLYQALHLSASSTGVLYLSREHCQLLTGAINLLAGGKGSPDDGASG